jgi:hypothetical protein
VRNAIALGIGLIACTSSTAGDEPFAAHIGGPFLARPHTPERAGTKGIARFTTPSISPNEAGGYVGGNRLFAPAGTSTTPNPGVFGWDYVGHDRFPGRIFQGFGPDRAHQAAFQPKYRTEASR